jgi:hypothetical protein
MAPNKAIETLKSLAKRSQAASDVFHEMAMRERTRNQITIRALALRMSKAGFKHPQSEYEVVLKALADCGFGNLKYSKRGRVTSVVGIQTTLQSIGKAVVQGADMLKNNAIRNKYSPIRITNDPVPARTEPQKQQVIRDLAKSADLVKAILDADAPKEQKLELLNVLMK